MDPFEKKIKSFYLEKKREDEKDTPGFSTLLSTPVQAKTTKWPNFFLKIAASVLVVAGGVLFYFYNSSNHTVTTLREIPEINLDQPLPSEALLNQGPGTQYIWQWKAPTDKLLDKVNESLGTIKNSNL